LNIRLHPSANVTSLISTMAAAGISLKADGSMLSASQHGQAIDVSTSLRALMVKPETRANFVQSGPGADVQHISDLDQKGKSEFITSKGLAAYTELVAASRGAKLRADVDLGPDASAKDVKNWTTAEKSRFITQFGTEAFSRCVSRK